MGRFDNLLREKTEEVKIGEETFTITPLSGDYIGLITEAKDGKEGEVFLKLAKESLKIADSTLTDEDIGQIPFKYMSDVIQAVVKVNEFDK